MSFKDTLIERKYELALFFCIIVYTTLFTFFTYMKHYSFSSFAWDLGVFNQVFYSSIYGGKPFYYTAELYLNPQGNYFTIHFSPILLLLFPFYALVPSPSTLLFLKSLILSLAAFPLFYLMRELTSSEKVSLAVCIVYLLHPGVQGANWFDFQPQVFLPLLIFSVYYLLLKGRWLLFSVSTLLALSVEEHVFSILILFFLSQLALKGASPLIASLRERKLNEPKVLLLSILACAVFYYYASRYIRSFPIRHEFRGFYEASSVFNVIGFEGNTLLLPIYVLRHLDRAFMSLIHDFSLKFLYVLFLLAPSCSPRWEAVSRLSTPSCSSPSSYPTTRRTT